MNDYKKDINYVTKQWLAYKRYCISMSSYDMEKDIHNTLEEINNMRRKYDLNDLDEYGEEVK